jgi:hypothetical protein
VAYPNALRPLRPRILQPYLHRGNGYLLARSMSPDPSLPCSFHADLVMNDLLGNHIELRHRIPRPVVGQEPGTVFVGMNSRYHVASGSFSVVKFVLI